MSAIAILVSLTAQDLERAQKNARESDAERARFHRQYVFAVGDPVLQQIEVTTDFRRAVLVTEERLRQGDWMFSQSVRALQEALRPTVGRVTFTAQLRFNPLNAYVAVPHFELAIGAPGGPLAPIETTVTPQYSLPFKTPTGPGTSLLGATLEGDLMAAGLGQAARAVGVILEGKEVARVTIDFAKLE